MAGGAGEGMTSLLVPVRLLFAGIGREMDEATLVGMGMEGGDGMDREGVETGGAGTDGDGINGTDTEGAESTGVGADV